MVLCRNQKSGDIQSYIPQMGECLNGEELVARVGVPNQAAAHI